MVKILITGSCGFVGSHTVEHFLNNTDWEVIGLDSFRHGGFSSRKRHLDYKVITHDLSTPIDEITSNEIGQVDVILNLASNSHVDHSIDNPAPFIANNVALMTNILSFAQQAKVKKFIHCSTDEVFGPAMPNEYHKEWDMFYPSNPYSASKTAQEAIGFSYWRTYDMPYIVTRCMNMIGERQGAEKFLPLLIRKIYHGETVSIHGTAENIGSRMYLHARNLADAWMYIINNVEPKHYCHDTETRQVPEAFNIIGDEELTNLELAELVADIMGKTLKYEFQDFHSVRPGHDLRYALDGGKLRKHGWNPPMSLRESIEKTINWTLKHEEWIK